MAEFSEDEEVIEDTGSTSAGEEEEDEDDSPSLLEQAATAIQGALGLSASTEGSSSSSASNSPPVAPSPAPAPAPPPAAAVAAKAAKEKKKKVAIVPKNSQQFFAQRSKDPKSFRFTKDGNLQVPESDEGAASVIEIPYYRRATVDELREVEEKRLNDLAAKEAEYNDLKQQLRTEMEAWRESGIAKNVMRLQKDLQRVDAERTFLRTPLMWSTVIKHLDKRQIDFSNMNEKKKLGHMVNVLRIRHHLFTEMVIKSNTPFEEEVKEEVVSSPEEGAKEESFIIFFDPADQDYGFLSPDTRNPFVFRSIRYFAPIQAYESERVKELGRDLDIGAAIRKQPTARMVRKKASELTGNVKEPRQLWVEIIKALVAQNVEAQEKLRATDTDVLVYAHPTDAVAGIGLPEEDENVGNRKAWKGKNYLGEAWMAARQALVESGAPASSEGEAAHSGGGSQEAVLDFIKEDATRASRQQEQRKGVFVARYKYNNHA